MNQAQNRQENVAMPEAEVGNPDEIWILREGAACADVFLSSSLPADVNNVAGFRRHIKNHYNDYSSIDADKILIKDK
ncbi:hypothetical protein MP638_004204, partial [Amoeboaphelidium occidentale]